MDDEGMKLQPDQAAEGPTAKPVRKSTKAKACERAAEASQAFILHIQLAYSGEDVWRRVAVPAQATFSQLHKIIQACFNWQDSHLHLFQVQNDRGEIVAESKTGFDDEDFSELQTYDRFSERKKLAHFLPGLRQMTYTYDLGDDWLHLIELEQVAEGSDGPLPVCLDGAGDAPPEDVGGEPGYEAFLKAVRSTATSKKALKEQANCLAWAEEQGWQPFDRDAVNARLKRIGAKMKRA